jgi:hypothetical protein
MRSVVRGCPASGARERRGSWFTSTPSRSPDLANAASNLSRAGAPSSGLRSLCRGVGWVAKIRGRIAGSAHRLEKSASGFEIEESSIHRSCSVISWLRWCELTVVIAARKACSFQRVFGRLLRPVLPVIVGKNGHLAYARRSSGLYTSRARVSRKVLRRKPSPAMSSTTTIAQAYPDEGVGLG